MKCDKSFVTVLQGWVVASDSVTETSYTVRGLQPDTSYMFLVRAQNSHGLSLPSPVTSAVRTRGTPLPVVVYYATHNCCIMILGQTLCQVSHLQKCVKIHSKLLAFPFACCLASLLLHSHGRLEWWQYALGIGLRWRSQIDFLAGHNHVTILDRLFTSLCTSCHC